MKIETALKERRSIRRFTEKPVTRAMVEKVLEAATLAPSGKNAQPWEFVVLEGEARNKLADLMIAGAEQAEQLGMGSGSARNSAAIIRQAPVTIVVFNPRWRTDADWSGTKRYLWAVDTQSLGAAIQNMLLQAHGLGLGSLWICDVFFADRAICQWLGRNDELVAAVSLGWPAEQPAARPRKHWRELTRWYQH